jgi:NADH:ubiquinone oxidoreductase subunit B-like Fe-S oxidoreductase
LESTMKAAAARSQPNSDGSQQKKLSGPVTGNRQRLNSTIRRVRFFISFFSLSCCCVQFVDCVNSLIKLFPD